MARVCLTIEYDGTAYHGWQVQPCKHGDTVQAVVECALAKIVKHPVRIHSSGRTDAGVHALGMKAHFDSPTRLPESAYCEGVNACLPLDIAIKEAVFVADDFHARFNALGKLYRYSIYTDSVRSPLQRLYAWHIRHHLDPETMRQAASTLEGKHDFAAFRSSSCAAQTTIRTLRSIHIHQKGDFIRVDVYGDGFLKNMVRIIVGLLVAVGKGRIDPEVAQQMLLQQQRPREVFTAPATGLCLMRVDYEKPDKVLAKHLT
ncbi:MAG: tRNA pseudouridine(38-40) synthase TruA [Geobacteraceae bacterium]|nr:tRNA pseudouridine(38-40) synthase TruA [Geobacteraceae bacterium]